MGGKGKQSGSPLGGKQVTVRLPDARYAELFAVAAITGIAAASIVRSAIFEKLEKLQAERKAA